MKNDLSLIRLARTSTYNIMFDSFVKINTARSTKRVQCIIIIKSETQSLK